MGDTAEPQWLSDEQQLTWRSMTAMLTQLPAALDAQLQRDAGISHFEYSVLSALSMEPDRTMRMSILAAFVQGALPRLSQVVARMEKRGWIRRAPDPTDGRATLAVLTDSGWEKVVATAPGHVSEVRRLVFDVLTKSQQRQMREVANRVVGATNPDDPCFSGPN
ncbi:MarR family winged helix-turn-helix transcriptional regulator [Cryptosporangium phraense]|uniref:Winged helix-turn-helix transcriptional regulator n=1 Tax=Cryptosporangium phraense TaxID=2593070 RepID=A0A545AUV2_9ACTN|nr:MarR family winged helix-turn-helix transcriptional regulator [Cryptosporangium phraense]TQS45106.1 winged helix-turn-helix transcriptional regulator [Cryptosporangium phraense]